MLLFLCTPRFLFEFQLCGVSHPHHQLLRNSWFQSLHGTNFSYSNNATLNIITNILFFGLFLFIFPSTFICMRYHSFPSYHPYHLWTILNNSLSLFSRLNWCQHSSIAGIPCAYFRIFISTTQILCSTDTFSCPIFRSIRTWPRYLTIYNYCYPTNLPANLVSEYDECLLFIDLAVNIFYTCSLQVLKF